MEPLSITNPDLKHVLNLILEHRFLRIILRWVMHVFPMELVANITRGNHAMWTGTDFKYQYAEPWFRNMDKFIHYVNKAEVVVVESIACKLVLFYHKFIY